ICPYGAMAIFILNKISVLEPRTQSRVRSASIPQTIASTGLTCAPVIIIRFLLLPSLGSSTPNRGRVKLYRKRGSRHTSRGNVSTHSQEERHGPHDDILPQLGLPCQRPNRPGQYRYPFAEGAALHLPRVS